MFARAASAVSCLRPLFVWRVWGVSPSGGVGGERERRETRDERRCIRCNAVFGTWRQSLWAGAGTSQRRSGLRRDVARSIPCQRVPPARREVRPWDPGESGVFKRRSDPDVRHAGAIHVRAKMQFLI